MTKSSGTTLIEVLISLILLSLILFGLDAVQLTSLRLSKIQYYFAVAEQQINNMRERLTSPLNEKILSEWNQQNASLLPEGRGSVSEKTITISWGQKSEEGCEKTIIDTPGCLQVQR